MLMLVAVALLAGLSTTLGALPLLFVRQLPRSRYDTLLGFGAGLMLAAATLGLLPAAFASGSLLPVLGGFLVGVAALMLADRLIPHQHAGGHHSHSGGAEDAVEHAGCDHQSPQARAHHHGLLVLGAMTLHRLPEGFAVGAGFASGNGRSLGIMLAIATALQNCVEGAVMATPLGQSGMRPRRLIALVTLSGLSLPFCACIGFLFSTSVAGALPVALSIGAGALIYLVCSEIIPESHSHKNERHATVGLLIGFVLIMLLQQLTGHSD